MQKKYFQVGTLVNKKLSLIYFTINLNYFGQIDFMCCAMQSNVPEIDKMYCSEKALFSIILAKKASVILQQNSTKINVTN
jgi:K+ transporter